MNSIVSEKILMGMVQNACHMVCGVRISPAETLDPEPAASDPLVAQVAFRGEWQGHLTMAFSRPLAHDLAARMYGLGREPLSEEDVLDAIAELTNITGGRIKAAINNESDMSLPTLIPAEVLAQRNIHGQGQSWRSDFTLGEQRLCVSLHE